jgi:hypothetical protein
MPLSRAGFFGFFLISIMDIFLTDALELDALDGGSATSSRHLHLDAVVHAVHIVIFTSVICTSAGLAGTERSFLGHLQSQQQTLSAASRVEQA